MFLGGLPNYGAGQLSAERYTSFVEANIGDCTAHDFQQLESARRDRLLQPFTNFYEQCAQRASNLGVCTDLFVLPGGTQSTYVDLASISALCSMTGGHLTYLPNPFVDMSAFAHDLYVLLFVIICKCFSALTSTVSRDCFAVFCYPYSGAHVSSPFAYNGVLRLRTPPAIKVLNAYGHLAVDNKYSNIFNIAGCDQYKVRCSSFVPH